MLNRLVTRVDRDMWLAGAHAAAAIFHHLVRKDGVLLAMKPKMGRR
ncbi:hypothetical protein [Rhodoferax saidenbachensis]|uniref:Cytochrome b561 n=1 Tax=Rhodoferax saidenbachensis TaxID=1484693 RepID=A0ABU1ZGW1_9BURK|nr:hypothetical protein [Rhodoferax saidenbachensis]MDR7304779.1 cytochrome b561 [Rhodoferax saidenbachensis]